MSRGGIANANGVLLLATLPFLLRIWLEAVVWRIDDGPQMLGFSLMHAGAGAFTVPLLISLLAVVIYLFFALVVAALSIVPSIRARMLGTRWVIFGGLGVFGFEWLAGYLQSDLSAGLLYAGAFVLSAIVLFLLIVAAVSVRLAAWA